MTYPPRPTGAHRSHKAVIEDSLQIYGMSDSATIVNKLWNYCNVLRDDGLSYQDYLEQITFLLFLKMADEQTRPPFGRQSIVPHGLGWASLVGKDGDQLEDQYRHTLAELGRQPGT